MAYFFDMDGTLIDSRADLAATVNHTRRDLGLAELPQDEILCHVGHGAKYLLAHAIPEQFAVCSLQLAVCSDGHADFSSAREKDAPRQLQTANCKLQTNQQLQAANCKLQTLFMSHYGEHMLESVTLYPGVRETLVELKKRGHKLGINTAKPRFATMAILEHFGLVELFEGAVVAGGDCAEMKPSALPLRQCAGLMPGHVLSSADWMVGDNWTDIKCAENASVKGAFCSYGFGILADSHPTITISSISQLLDEA